MQQQQKKKQTSIYIETNYLITTAIPYLVQEILRVKSKITKIPKINLESP